MTISYLKRYGNLKRRIQNEKEHLAQLRSIVEDTSVHLSPLAGRNPSTGRGKFENTMLDIVEEEKKTDEKIRKLGLLQAEIENLINSLEDEEHQELLRHIYLEETPPTLLAVLNYTSRAGVYRKLNEALEAVYALRMKRENTKIETL